MKGLTEKKLCRWCRDDDSCSVATPGAQQVRGAAARLAASCWTGVDDIRPHGSSILSRKLYFRPDLKVHQLDTLTRILKSSRVTYFTQND